MKPREVRLREFLSNSNIATPKSPPWVHSAPSSKLIKIIQDEKLVAMKCDVFKGEKLCYLFVGRAAYKGRDALNPEAWQLPSVFVMRFATPPPIKRIYPFDTGAFDRNRMPSYLTAFDMQNFELGSDDALIGRLISLYFDTPRRYVDRKSVDEDKIKEEHVLDMSHAEILALGKLYREGSTKNYDDRAAAIEVQVGEDIPLRKQDLLGVVIPEEYMRTDGVRESLLKLTKYIETYRLLPLSLSQHYSSIYDAVERIYKKAGVNI
ncbi:hypothetical protein FBZ96_11580 [Bradyrhizobium stylosanthis]|uniref:Uncharacterized protein n=2 Tax=Bradyrhizobium TaxID=374 RepID=A0A0R3E113_9BRAD|nr:hypothetical protein AOQ71_07150 [Bradyrhizobium manausense]TWA90410.1 hypothetical protein FBZ96_11580 [Bradyrhizobium stylosanthis]